MAIMLPKWAGDTFGVFDGGAFPMANEDRLEGLGLMHVEIANGIATDKQTLVQPLNMLELAFEGDGATEARQTLTELLNSLEELGKLHHTAREQLYEWAIKVEYMKVSTLIMLAQALATLLYLYLMAEYTAGATLFLGPEVVALANQTAWQFMEELAASVVINELIALVTDASIQLGQMANGDRAAWDKDITKLAAIGAAAGGLLGPVIFTGMNNLIAGLTDNILAKIAGNAAAGAAMGAAATVATQAITGEPIDVTPFALTAGAFMGGAGAAAAEAGARAGAAKIDIPADVPMDIPTNGGDAPGGPGPRPDLGVDQGPPESRGEDWLGNPPDPFVTEPPPGVDFPPGYTPGEVPAAGEQPPTEVAPPTGVEATPDVTPAAPDATPAAPNATLAAPDATLAAPDAAAAGTDAAAVAPPATAVSPDTIGPDQALEQAPEKALDDSPVLNPHEVPIPDALSPQLDRPGDAGLPQGTANADAPAVRQDPSPLTANTDTGTGTSAVRQDPPPLTDLGRDPVGTPLESAGPIEP